jgi:DNA-binding SARP family transcriptional activator/tetratricopeptide (TPR) repeat protein
MPRKLLLLGVPGLSGAVTPSSLPAKAWLLFAMLALAHNRSERKAKAAGIIFAGSRDPSAALRQLTHRIRAALGEPAIRVLPNELQLGDLTTDLEGLMRRDPVGSAAEANAVSRTPPLLDSLEFDEHDASAWVETARQMIRDRIVHIVLGWAGRAAPRECVEPLLILFDHDPGNTAVAAQTVDVLLRLERRLDALRVVESFAEWRGDEEAAKGIIASLRAKVAPLYPQSATALAFPVIMEGLRGVPRVIFLRPSGTDHPRGTRLMLDSLIEDLSLELAASQDVAVIAPNTAWRIADDHAGHWRVPTIADYALSSSMRPSSGDRPIVTLTLLKTSSGEIVWVRQVALDADRERDGYGSVLRAIVGGVVGSVERAELLQLRRSGLPTAYRAYLMGRHHLRTLDLRDIRRARRWFRTSAEIDPDYSRAHSWLGHTLVLEWLMMTGRDFELLDTASQEARLAIDLDPLDPNGHRVLARAQLFEGRMDESLEGLARAERLGPHFADLLADYADTLAHHSAAAEARAKIDLAISLNPIPPDTYLWIAAGADFALGDFAGALEKLGRMSNKDQVYRLMAASAAMLGDADSAYKYRTEALSIDPFFEIHTWIQRLPIRRREHLELYVAALKKAGFR